MPTETWFTLAFWNVSFATLTNVRALQVANVLAALGCMVMGVVRGLEQRRTDD